jgi:two-component system, cell cycle sensor histidine kinase and response regulator CckA
MTMPELGGDETFRELRRIRPDVRVLLSSGYSEGEAMYRFTGKGLAGFLQKPYRPQALLDRLAGILAD